MASKQPFVFQVDFRSVILHLLILALFGLLFFQVDRSNFHLYSLAAYLVLVLLLRNTIPKNHRKGISFFKKKEYEQAIRQFEKSLDFFDKHAWLDKYRFLFLMSSSRIAYREMAMLNKAFCLSQLSRKGDAIHWYKKVLEDYPDSQMALSALKMLE